MVDSLIYEATLLSLADRRGKEFSDSYAAFNHVGERGVVEFAYYCHTIRFVKYFRESGRADVDWIEWKVESPPVVEIIEDLPSLTIITQSSIYVFLVHEKIPNIDTQDYFRRFCVDETYSAHTYSIIDDDGLVYHADKRGARKMTYEELYTAMTEKVFGQDEYVESLCMTVMNSWGVNKFLQKGKEAPLPANTLLVAGETGSGKTYAVSVLAKIIDANLIVIDMSKITGTGYKGKTLDVEIASQLRNIDYYSSRPLIFFFDELDKALYSDYELSKYKTGDVVPELLKLVEEGIITASEERNGETYSVRYKLNNPIFIFAGAFSGIEKIIEKRLEKSKDSRIGFIQGEKESMSEKEDVSRKNRRLYDQICNADFAAYNLDWQFLGRMSRTCVLNRLTPKDYVRLIKESKDSIFQRSRNILGEYPGVGLEITERACELAGEICGKLGVGARGLDATLTKVIDIGRREAFKRQDVEKIVIDAKNGELVAKTVKGFPKEDLRIYVKGTYPKWVRPQRKNDEPRIPAVERIGPREKENSN